MSLWIERIEVEGFGPLRRLVLEPGELTVVEGDNESGKSSLVDALHAWLRGTFRRANAPALEPTRRGLPGYAGSVEVRLVGPEGRDAAFPPELLSENPILWNLLVIPEGGASNRTIGSRGTDWLDEAKRHLTGFDPEPLRRRLRERAGLTPTLQDARDWKERGHELGALEDRLSALFRSLDDLAPAEADLREARRVLGDLEREAALERRAVAHDRYRRARRALEALLAARGELERLARFTEPDLELWRRAERRRAHDDAAVAAARRSLEEREREREAAEERVRGLERERSEAEARVSQVRGSGIVARAEELRRRIEEAAHHERRMRGRRWPARALGGVGAAGLAAGVVLLARGADPAGGAAIGAGALMLLLAVWQLARGAGAAARTDGVRSEAAPLLEDARALGLAVEAPEDVARRATDLERDALVAGERLAGARTVLDRLHERRDDARGELREAEQALAAIDREIGQLRERSGLGRLEELEARVRARREAEARAAVAEETLGELFPEVPHARWPDEVEAARVDDPGRPPGAGRLEELETAREAQRTRVAELQAATEGRLRQGLAALGLEDLDAARALLDRTLEERDRRRLDRAACELALAAVDAAERDVDANLDRVLDDPAGGAGALFAQLTAGRWTGIRRTRDGLEAVGPDGSGVTAPALSRGTRDQLHFALRAALAERVLGEPSFFVWDDTFLTADPARRRALVETSVALVRRGWQILYLTVDPGIADLFERAARAQEVAIRRVRLTPDADAGSTGAREAESRSARGAPADHA